jgi:hypothetical protein
MSYAALHWHQHVDTEVLGDVQNLECIEQFLEQRTRYIWGQLYETFYEDSEALSVKPDTCDFSWATHLLHWQSPPGSEVYYSSLFGWSNLVDIMIQRGKDVNEEGGWHGRPLTPEAQLE